MQSLPVKFIGRRMGRLSFVSPDHLTGRRFITCLSHSRKKSEIELTLNVAQKSEPAGNRPAHKISFQTQKNIKTEAHVHDR